MENGMRLRQIALVAHDLEKARADIVAVLGLGPDYADPGVAHFGLENAVWPIGDTFLEVVSPKQAGTTAGRLLLRFGACRRCGAPTLGIHLYPSSMPVPRAASAPTTSETRKNSNRRVARSPASCSTSAAT